MLVLKMMRMGLGLGKSLFFRKATVFDEGS